MRFSLLAALAAGASAASQWSFSDAKIEVIPKAASADATTVSHTFTDKERVKDTITLGHADEVKVSLTAKEGSKGKRPHQAFLMVKEKGGLEAPYALTVKESGKGTVEFVRSLNDSSEGYANRLQTQKDLPIQLLSSTEPLEASLVLGSFGSTKAAITPVFDLTVRLDPNAPTPNYEAPLRYGKQPEIHHIFRDDPKSPPKIVSIVFALAVLATVPGLVVGVRTRDQAKGENDANRSQWTMLGANLTNAQKALGNAPVSHITFFGSIIAMEGVFFLYYTGLSLFSTLPIAGVVGVVAFLSGTKALGEVQSRRLAER